ncbi:hypothetical protein GC105_03550 [Alkalibaculum sp. M08DMB]|uniref:Uncharacterized protein n=1 Tax=Alkalibaculum sporogenes TaxID=2655001 RepID=A0A6A7K671_9FIRM|nr:hypothetical protein [Alkalibaculum sporogenes]MPW24864.1 hypothetical protein [Alkalibaculum sporogenes]
MNLENLSYLDNLRLKGSVHDFKLDFILLVQENEKKTIAYLNDDNLRFPTLFDLIPEIDAYEITRKLNLRNKLAIKICHITHTYRQVEKIDKLSSDKNTIQILRWMFKTGVAEDSTRDELDQILDDVISLLIVHYHDYDILPDVADLIFKRNRNEKLVHDLVWSFFKSNDPITLKLVSDFLQSKEVDDVQLACKLLHFDPNNFKNIHPQRYFHTYKKWLEENDPYLYFTGESLQLTSDPNPCKLNMEAKYLNKSVSYDSGKLTKLLTPIEKKHLQDFQKISSSDKELLSNYSNKIYKDDIRTWKKWMENDIVDQLQTAKNSMEGYR